MSTVTVREGQSLCDLAVQCFGHVSAAFHLAQTNGLGITDLLQPGQVLALGDAPAALRDARVTAYLAANEIFINNNKELQADASSGVFDASFDSSFA
jgi:hypothetical protein